MGIVFLLFAVGLEYPIARLRAVGSKALVLSVLVAGLLILVVGLGLRGHEAHEPPLEPIV